MSWRIRLSTGSTTRTDFAYYLGNESLIFSLEVWLGIIIACLPTLGPIVGKYLKPLSSRLTDLFKKRTTQEADKEALHRINVADPRRFRSKRFSRLDSESLIGLGSSAAFLSHEMMAKPPLTAGSKGKDILTGAHDTGDADFT